MRKWSKGAYPSWHIRRDAESSFCGRPLVGEDYEGSVPPDSGRTCEQCYRREADQRPPGGSSDAGN